MPNVELILSNKELDLEQRSKLIGQLADMRRMGKRGHLKFDVFALILTLVFWLTVLLH